VIIGTFDKCDVTTMSTPSGDRQNMKKRRSAAAAVPDGTATLIN